MTVHNNAGKLPIEYNDIEIARRFTEVENQNII